MPNVKNGRRYQIKNWSKYNTALIQRGSLTIWVENNAIEEWFASERSGQSGRPNLYSDTAILTLLIVRQVFHLPLRALQGFVSSVFLLMGLSSLSVPSYTQISRRAKTLERQLNRLLKKGAKELVFDSSGLKVYGEGEWKVRIHGRGKRRTWRKLHIGIDPDSQEVVVYELTSNAIGDAMVAERLLESVDELERVYGDGGYDGNAFRQAAEQRGADCIVPPPRDATYKGIEDGWQRVRDAALAEITGLGGGEGGRELWKKLKGYHRRSLVETAFFRIKTLFGEKLKARSFAGQQAEVYATCLALNRMTSLGMPDGEWIAAA